MSDTPPDKVTEAMMRIVNPQDYDGDIDAWYNALGTLSKELGRQYRLLTDASADFPEFDAYYDALVVRGVSYIDVDGEKGVYDLVSWVRDLLSIARDGHRVHDPMGEDNE